jgi:subtilisin family serine protease
MSLDFRRDQNEISNRYFFYLKVGKIAQTIFIEHPILSLVALYLSYRILKKAGIKFSDFRKLGGKLLQIHRRLNAFVVEFRNSLTPEQLQWIRDHLHLDIEPVKTVTACMDTAVTQTGVDIVRTQFQGEGINVAVVDTGIYSKHPDFENRVIARKNFASSTPNWPFAFKKPALDKLDGVGHGTHCAGTIGGNGPTYRGVAPKAVLIDAKVLGDNGSGSTDQVIKGMSWAADQGADIISMSLGGSGDPDDAISREANLLAQEGIVVVCAAGNEGPRSKTIGSPGCAANVITVGAVDKKNKLTSYSSRGPVTDKFGKNLNKPDILAPGGGIVPLNGCSYGDGIISVKSLDVSKDKCTVVDNRGISYEKMSGSSMSTPHISGICALLLEASKLTKNTKSRCEITKTVLKKTAKNLGYGLTEQGAGLVDAQAALNYMTKSLGEPNV